MDRRAFHRSVFCFALADLVELASPAPQELHHLDFEPGTPDHFGVPRGIAKR